MGSIDQVATHSDKSVEWPTSSLCSLNELINLPKFREPTVNPAPIRFRIPPYQRMYVWGLEQVRQLLADIYDAWTAGEKQYFIGGVLAVEREIADGKERSLELIDGQQRLITLWLLTMERYRASLRKEFTRVDESNEKKLWSFVATISPTGSTSQSEERTIPRLHFDIRDRANQWLQQQLESRGGLNSETDEELDEERERATHKLARGLEWIKGWSSELEKIIDGNASSPSFDYYLLNNVRLLVTRVPPSMDLNHLFEVINDRSVQLEHHEILKERLLNLLRVCQPPAKQDQNGYPVELEAYSWLWDACAAMDTFVEDSLKQIKDRQGTNLPSQIARTIQQDKHIGSVGGTALSVTNALPDGKRALMSYISNASSEEKDKTVTLSLDTLARRLNEDGAREPAADNRDSGLTEEKESEVRSIVSFPVLLQHTLRLWLYRHANEEDLSNINDRDLLGQFKRHLIDLVDKVDKNDPEDPERGWLLVRDFFSLLWEVRWLFDLHIIKWVRGNDEDQWTHTLLRLEPQSQNSSHSLQRAESEQQSDQAFSMLQSLLYHTQNPAQQMWLTPFLGYLHRRCFGLKVDPEGPYERQRHPSLPSTVGGDDRLSKVEDFLRRLDDGLNCVPAKGRTLAERTRIYLENPSLYENEIDLSPIRDRYFGEIPQYWFYKIDYILWLETVRAIRGNRINIPSQKVVPTDTIKGAWLNFRLTARSTVEHIQAQKAKDFEKRVWEDDSRSMLHRIGNLALVSRSRNSEFGNRSFEQKRSQFLERLKAGDLVSPKLAWVYLFNGNPWEEHEQGDGSLIWTPEAAERHERAILESVYRYFGINPAEEGAA